MAPLPAIYLCGPIAEPGRPAKGGYQSRNLRTIEALRERGLEVHALPYAQPDPPRLRKLIDYAAGFSRLALKMFGCKKKSIVHITGLRRFFLYPELVLVHIAKLRKCRVIYDVRDGLGLDAIWLGRSSFYRYCFSHLLNSVDMVMVQGATQVPFVKSFTGREPVLVPNQIDLSAIPARLYSEAQSQTPVIAYAGALRAEKGISTILEAAEMLVQKGFEVIVRIAGTGDEAYVDGLRKRFDHLPVEWLGAQNTDQVLNLFTASHFFVFPTWWPGEGQSNALTEAMACGCVPIVSDHGFNAATVGECGVVVRLSQIPDRVAGGDEADEAVEYAAAVRRIWEGGQWADLSRRSAAHVRERYSSVAVVDHITEQYVDLEVVH